MCAGTLAARSEICIFCRLLRIDWNVIKVMSTVFITGITGYIGSRLAQMLLPEHIVCGLVRNPINRTYLPSRLERELRLFTCEGGGDILAALADCQPDVVYHLAAHYVPTHNLSSVDQLVESNLYLGAELLEAMAQTGCRKLVYATTTSTHSMGESYSPLTLYAATKQAFSDLVSYYTDYGFIRAAAVAIADSCGPGDFRPKVLNLIRRSALEGTRISLTSGCQMYDAVYIDDITRGLVCAADSLKDEPAHHFFQLHSKNALSLRETVELMMRVNNVSFQPDWGTQEESPRRMTNADPIYPPPPGWEPEVALTDGLRHFWNNA